MTLTDPLNPTSLTSQTDTVVVNGRTITRSYNAATRTYTDTTPAGRVSRTVLDIAGRPVQIGVGNLTPMELSYDVQGRLSGMARGTRVSTLAYDAAGNLASITDALSRTVSFAYDDAGRVTTQVLPDARGIGFTYDATGNVGSITPPGRPAHGFLYTPTNLQSEYLPPQPQPPVSIPETLYQYDRDSRLTRITRPDGQSINLDYDLLTGQLSRLRLPSGGLTHVYDPGTRNLQQVIAADGGTISYQYDGSLPIEEAWAGAIAGTVERSYDNSFRVASQSVNGNTVNFSYDADDLLTGAGAMTLARDATNGLLTGTTLGSVSDTLGYNTFGEVTTYSAAIGASPIFSVAYTRDVLGRISSKTETGVGRPATGDVWQYGYDAAGRLTDVALNGTLSAHYEYDLNGNRIGGFNQQGAITAAQYDDQDRLLATDHGPLSTAYTYTANGELLTKTAGSAGGPPAVTSYQYDVLGNLRRVDLPDGRVIEYIIDGQNRRVGKKVNGVPTQAWIYDGQLRVVAELDGSGAVISRFIYAEKVNVPEYMVRGGATYRIITDHLGSPRLVVSVADGTVAQRIDYDEFGNVLLDTNAGFQPFGFAGGLYDPDIGLVRFGARDYDPQTGRWTAKDSIGFLSGDSNLFGYVSQDPINDFDPSGKISLQSVTVAIGVSAVLAGTSVLVATSYQCAQPAVGSFSFAAGTSDKHKHCVLSCELARKCGSPASGMAGVGKKVQDVFGSGNAEIADLIADLVGIRCAAKGGNCVSACIGAGYPP